MASGVTIYGEEIMMPELDKMIAWEQGELNQEGEIELFQSLVDSGLAWQLQGAYGRHAQRLIEAGLIERPRGHR